MIQSFDFGKHLALGLVTEDRCLRRKSTNFLVADSRKLFVPHSRWLTIAPGRSGDAAVDGISWTADDSTLKPPESGHSGNAT